MIDIAIFLVYQLKYVPPVEEHNDVPALIPNNNDENIKENSDVKNEECGEFDENEQDLRERLMNIKWLENNVISKRGFLSEYD